MPILLAILSSVSFGVADFSGGMAAKRSPAISVVVGSQLVGLAVIASSAPFFGIEGLAGRELVWGAAAGIAGTVGLVVFYHALAHTTMNVAAPVAALFGTATPVVFGVAIGERPEAVAWLGVALVIPATMLIGSGSGRSSQDRLSGLAVWLGVAAGLAFGLFGIFISRTGADSGLWPLLAARVASLSILSLVVVATKRPVFPVAWGWVVPAGALDMLANILFLVAVRDELLTLVAVVMALYPAATLLLARVVVGERLQRVQMLGLGLAVIGVVLIAAV